MTKKILAIDDSRTMRGLLDQTLSGAGFAVELAEDGVDGLSKLENANPDLVITDINMPRLDGFGVIKGIRGQEKYRALPILVLTTETGDELKAKARAAGATGWIVKPFHESKLVAAINRIVA